MTFHLIIFINETIRSYDIFVIWEYCVGSDGLENSYWENEARNDENEIREETFTLAYPWVTTLVTSLPSPWVITFGSTNSGRLPSSQLKDNVFSS